MLLARTRHSEGRKVCVGGDYRSGREEGGGGGGRGCARRALCNKGRAASPSAGQPAARQPTVAARVAAAATTIALLLHRMGIVPKQMR